MVRRQRVGKAVLLSLERTGPADQFFFARGDRRCGAAEVGLLALDSPDDSFVDSVRFLLRAGVLAMAVLPILVFAFPTAVRAFAIEASSRRKGLSRRVAVRRRSYRG